MGAFSQPARSRLPDSVTNDQANVWLLYIMLSPGSAF
jgi:hypothetical protein